MDKGVAKEYESLSRNVNSLLKDFQKNREWADIGNWLSRLLPVLSAKKLPDLPHKVNLAKRLAQCLNPSLPAGVHSGALNVYNIILKNYGNKSQLLPLMSIGLFPFFEYSISSLKIELIKILQTHFISTPECLQMITSLMNALLTGLNENNEELAKKIFRLCDKVSEKYGRLWVDGAVWINILKSPKVRIAGFKYFTKSFKDREKMKKNKLSGSVNELKSSIGAKEKEKESPEKKQEEEVVQGNEVVVLENQAEIQDNSIRERGLSSQQLLNSEQVLLKKLLSSVTSLEDTDQTRFPNFPTLILNSLVECLQSQQSDKTLVKRSTLDLMIFHLKLDNRELISEKDAVQLIEVMLQMVKIKEYSLTRRIYTYLFGQPDMEGIYTIDEEARSYEFDILKKALMKILRVDHTDRINKISFGVEEKPRSRKSSLTIGPAILHNQQLVHTTTTFSHNNHHHHASEQQSCLTILQILIKDHPKLSKILLPSLSIQILQFLLHNSSKISEKIMFDFYYQIIDYNSDIFFNQILNKLLSSEVLENVKVAEELILTVEFYYSFRKRVEVEGSKERGEHERENDKERERDEEGRERKERDNEGNLEEEEVLTVIEWMLKYLCQTNCSHQRVSVDILQLCQKLLNFFPKPSQMHIFVNQNSIQLLNELILKKQSNAIYAGLLTLHPLPAKQMLLPYINEISLSTVCISNLLLLDPTALEQNEKKDLFFAIFKLLNCHLLEEQAVKFISKFKKKYSEIYFELIDVVDPSEWLIYWRKLGGDIEGGVIRMLKNLEDENPLNRQLSKKWLEGSKHIVSKVVDPVYKMMKDVKLPQEQLEENMNHKQGDGQDSNPQSQLQQQLTIKDYFKLIQNVFLIQKKQFITFFFIQRQKYFLPLLDKIFKCLTNPKEEDLKTHGINMLQFLLERANNLSEKVDFLALTLNDSVKLLKFTIEDRQNVNKYLREIEIISYFRGMVDIFASFINGNEKVEILKKIINESDMYEVMAMGMKQTSVPYVRTLYIDYIHESCETLMKVTADIKFTAKIVTKVVENLFIMLRENNVTNLEEIIRGKQQSSSSPSSFSRRKKSLISTDSQPTMFEQQKVSETQFNVQSKYAQVIELWNSIKFIVNLAIKNQIQDLPIESLLSLILQSFPFSYLEYEQISPHFMQGQYEKLQDQIRNVTGLKKEVLEIFHTLWGNYEDKIINVLIEKGDPRVLIHGSVDPHAVIKAITRSQFCKKIARFFKGTKFSLPRGTHHYNPQILGIQNQICYFLYIYMIYCNLHTAKNKKVAVFVESVLHLVKSLNITTHIQTKIWLLEVIYSLSQRLTFRQLYSEQNKIKHQLQDLVKDLFDQLTPICTKSRNFTHRQQIKAGIFSIFTKQQKQQTSLFDFIKIFPPTIHNLEQSFNHIVKNKKVDNVMHVDENIQVIHFLFVVGKWLNLSEEVYIKYLSVVTLKTYCKIFGPLMMNIFEHDLNKISSIMKENLLQMLPSYEDKSQGNQIYLENVAQFMNILISTPALKSEILKNMRKNIKDIYDGNDFFKCSKVTLNHWKTIIDCLTEGQDMLGELLSSGGLFDGIFTRKAQATRQKIKTFQRVCFIIYSGRVDKYENKLRVVLESVNEVMKSESPSPALLILILFCIRILFMRLSETTLNRMFRSIWPSLITLLIQIFTKEIFSKNSNLLLAGLKVIELIHALELDQFNIHRWIFIFDFFGIKLDSQNEQEQALSTDPFKILTPFKYKPILTRMLPENYFKCEYLPEQICNNVYDNRRKLNIKEASIDSDEELRNHAFVMLQNMIDLNQRRATVVREEIEDVIEADFISLDDYIFQLK